MLRQFSGFENLDVHRVAVTGKTKRWKTNCRTPAFSDQMPSNDTGLPMSLQFGKLMMIGPPRR